MKVGVTNLFIVRTSQKWSCIIRNSCLFWISWHVCSSVHLCRFECDESHKCVRIESKVYNPPTSICTKWMRWWMYYSCFKMPFSMCFQSMRLCSHKNIFEVLVFWCDFVDASSCLYFLRKSHWALLIGALSIRGLTWNTLIGVNGVAWNVGVTDLLLVKISQEKLG